MLFHLLTKHVGLVTWCKLVSNSTVLHLTNLFMDLCENDAVNGERKNLKLKILINRYVKKPCSLRIVLGLNAIKYCEFGVCA